MTDSFCPNASLTTSQPQKRQTDCFKQSVEVQVQSRSIQDALTAKDSVPAAEAAFAVAVMHLAARKEKNFPAASDHTAATARMEAFHGQARSIRVAVVLAAALQVSNSAAE